MAISLQNEHSLPIRILLLASILIIWLGFALRLHNLGGDSFWTDEIVTMQVIQKGSETILNQRDHPPLMYTLVSSSMKLIGEGEFAARLPSLYAGVLAIPLLILLGRMLGIDLGGLWAALLLTLTSFHVSQSQMARHYSLLMTISLASFVILYQGFKKPRWTTWLIYAAVTLLNLYTHYGALIVLTAQALLILVWLFTKWRNQKDWLKALRYPGVAALIVVTLYTPWLSRLQQVVKANVGEGVITGTGTVTPLANWLQRALVAFSLTGGLAAYLTLGLAILGLLALAWRRNWAGIGLIISGAVLPVVLIVSLQIARGAFPRYIIYMLPIYLLSAGIGLSTLIEAVIVRFAGTPGYLIASAGVAVALILISRPGLQGVYTHIQEDWRGILHYLDNSTSKGDILAALSLNYRNGFNLPDFALPYYLGEANQEYVFLSGNSIEVQDLTDLVDSKASVWAVVSSWAMPARLLESGLEVIPFQTSLFVVRSANQGGSSLEQLTDLYNRMIPLAPRVQQQCLLRLDAAALPAVKEDVPGVEHELAFVEKQCPELMQDERYLALNFMVLESRLIEASQAGLTQETRIIAAELLQSDPKHEAALNVLMAVNLLEMLADDQAVVQDAAAIEPVRTERFTMPHNGDWGDVLLTHPPSAVEYHLTLPEDPVEFHSRVALAPESWSWGGDGATFILTIEKDDGKPVTLYQQHIGSEVEDQDWHEVTVPLSDFAGQEIILTLSAEEGPAGDGTGDWAGWETPRLLWEVLEYEAE